MKMFKVLADCLLVLITMMLVLSGLALLSKFFGYIAYNFSNSMYPERIERSTSLIGFVSMLAILVFTTIWREFDFKSSFNTFLIGIKWWDILPLPNYVDWIIYLFIVPYAFYNFWNAKDSKDILEVFLYPIILLNLFNYGIGILVFGFWFFCLFYRSYIREDFLLND